MTQKPQRRQISLQELQRKSANAGAKPKLPFDGKRFGEHIMKEINEHVVKPLLKEINSNREAMDLHSTLIEGLQLQVNHLKQELAELRGTR